MSELEQLRQQLAAAQNEASFYKGLKEYGGETNERLMASMDEQDVKFAALEAELERVRSDRARLASAATLVVSNWDIFEIQDATARGVMAYSIKQLEAALG